MCTYRPSLIALLACTARHLLIPLSATYLFSDSFSLAPSISLNHPITRPPLRIFFTRLTLPRLSSSSHHPHACTSHLLHPMFICSIFIVCISMSCPYVCMHPFVVSPPSSFVIVAFLCHCFAAHASSSCMSYRTCKWDDAPSLIFALVVRVGAPEGSGLESSTSTKLTLTCPAVSYIPKARQ